jgi:hypothetical protein
MYYYTSIYECVSIIQGRMAYKFTNHWCLVGRAARFLAVQYSFGVCLGSECMYM